MGENNKYDFFIHIMIVIFIGRDKVDWIAFNILLTFPWVKLIYDSDSEMLFVWGEEERLMTFLEILDSIDLQSTTQ